MQLYVCSANLFLFLEILYVMPFIVGPHQLQCPTDNLIEVVSNPTAFCQVQGTYV